MSLLEGYPVELIEEVIENQRLMLDWYDMVEDHEEVLKCLLLIQYCDIELKVRELEAELEELTDRRPQ